MNSSLRWIVGFVCLLVVLGCGPKKDPHGRESLRGQVTFQGQPLNAGTIEFLPPDPTKEFGTRSLIQNGKYQIPAEQGVKPGTYRVLITSAESNSSEEPVGPPGMKMPPLGKERIPAKYNRDSRVTVEVKENSDNTFDFVIE
jgi:hypothetical protein